MPFRVTTATVCDYANLGCHEQLDGKQQAVNGPVQIGASESAAWTLGVISTQYTLGP